MTEAPLLRKMTVADLPAVLELLAAWNMVPLQSLPDGTEPEVDRIVVEHTFVALSGGRLVGVASYFLRGGGVAETASFAVRADWLGRGLGAALQAARLREMRGRRVSRVITQTDRPELVDWYSRRFGYRRVGENPKRHPFGRPDADRWTVLELDLTAWRDAGGPPVEEFP